MPKQDQRIGKAQGRGKNTEHFSFKKLTSTFSASDNISVLFFLRSGAFAFPSLTPRISPN